MLARGTAGLLARPAGLDERIKLVCFALCVANGAFLAAMFAQGLWLIEPGGGGVATDFVNVWAAGRLVLDGNPAGAYDVLLHKHVQELAVGHSFSGFFGWCYPPFFLFVAAPLALLPYPAAAALWSFATFPAYLVTVRRIVGAPLGLLLACAFPGVVSNVAVGQNGFLTAALLGGALVAMPARPIVAGCLLGLMTYKPQFGLLFPLVLVAAGEWRTFFSAAVTAAALAAVSLLIWGTAPWIGFIHSLGVVNDAVLGRGEGDFQKLQSLFGLARAFGATEGLAWALQATLGLALAGVLWPIWRGRLRFELKAAALATAALLATPYMYVYDLVVLAVPMAFLVRLARRDGARPYEWAGLALASLLVLSFPFVKAPVGFAAVVVVALLVARRMLEARLPRLSAV